MEELISVIVPVYKVEKYLAKCVDSIINQTYKNLEIILVDDGSPDSCPKMCDEYAKKDNRIKVIHKNYEGVSNARNAGLNIATGEYIAFVDSDDYIDSTMYKKLYDAIKQNDCDLAVCGFYQVDETGDKVIGESINKYSILRSNYERILYDTKEIGNIGVVVWNKLYDKSIFNNLRYPNYKIYEDEYVAYDVLQLINKGIVVLNDKLYFYRKRKYSITTSQITTKNLDAIDAIKHRLDKIDYNSVYYKEVCSQYLNTFFNLYKRSNDRVLKNKIFNQFIVEYKKYKKYMNLKRKIKYFLFRYFKITIK